MAEIKVSLIKEMRSTKPTGQEIARLSNEIPHHSTLLGLSDLKTFAEGVGSKGYTFSPATFKCGKRKKEYFEQQQLIALDFDNKDPNRTVSFDEVKARARSYALPILFAYETLSSVDQNKFRVVFLNDISIPNKKIVEAMQLAMGEIFPEADPSCYGDVSKMYFGGKKCLYYDDTIPTINIDTLFRSFHYCVRRNHGEKHYKEKIRRFSKKTNISLTDRKSVV